ncbi:hypothetical protein [Emticicia sp. W12TSBA100-4]|uniref:hypothetical protein n=1 Tax=Emticicia sp. W12TSBA100-4 TaxID=3160965 RepID=UPI003305FB6B
MQKSAEKILELVLSEMSKRGVTKRKVYQYLDIAPTSLDNYFKNKYPISLQHYLSICELLELNPSFFFEANHTNVISDSNVQTATGKGIKQTIGASASHDNKETEILRVENEGLKKENALLREMIEMYKNK